MSLISESNDSNYIDLDINDNKNVILDSDTILQIINEIQTETIPSMDIRKKYNLSKYRFYKIINDHNLRTPTMTRGPKCKTGPKKTPFKQLLHGTEEEQRAAKILPEHVNIDDFVTDCKNKVKISELMTKYHLSLYQVRELRIIHDVKTK